MTQIRLHYSVDSQDIYHDGTSSFYSIWALMLFIYVVHVENGTLSVEGRVNVYVRALLL